MGTAFAVAVVAVAMQLQALWFLLTSFIVTTISAAYFRKRIGGVTGDCMGATNQITEVAVYFTGTLLR